MKLYFSYLITIIISIDFSFKNEMLHIFFSMLINVTYINNVMLHVTLHVILIQI